MSTTLSAMTAAELVAELKRLDLLIQKMAEMHRQTVWDFAPRDKATSLQDITNRTNDRFAVVAELDARCGHWGFELTKTEQGHIWSIGKTLIGDRGNHYQCNVFAEQFHALLGYLLTKGGAK